MKIIWPNIFFMWALSIIGCVILEHIGFSETSAGILSGVITGFSFAMSGIPLVKDQVKK